MRLRFIELLLALASASVLAAAEPVYLDNLPVGSVAEPLVLRTYLPDPGLGEAVLSHHFRGQKALEYNPEQGEDVPGEVEPIAGLPAGIAVSHGRELSYVFDTTEGRLLYAWQDGFLDMFPYWGDTGSKGSMLYRDYVPRLIGTLFYLADGTHPLEIEGRSVTDIGPPRFAGYDLVENQPVFIVRYGRHTVRTRIQPVAGQRAMQVEFNADTAATLSFRSEDARLKISAEQTAPGALRVTVSGPELASFEGYSRKPALTEASIAAGEQLYRNYGCMVCHSLDGALSIGPTFAGLYGRDRPVGDGTMVKGDEAYLLESIKEPNARLVEGFSRSLMPAFNQLHQLEYESLILFIQSMGQQP